VSDGYVINLQIKVFGLKLKAFAILAIILFSLFPVYLLYRYLQKIIRPQESMKRFILCLLAVFTLIFVYSFSLVFIIKIMFPGA
jgi:hypothetical protein